MLARSDMHVNFIKEIFIENLAIFDCFLKSTLLYKIKGKFVTFVEKVRSFF